MPPRYTREVQTQLLQNSYWKLSYLPHDSNLPPHDRWRPTENDTCDQNRWQTIQTRTVTTKWCHSPGYMQQRLKISCEKTKMMTNSGQPIVLCCTVLCRAVPYHTVLYYTIHRTERASMGQVGRSVNGKTWIETPLEEKNLQQVFNPCLSSLFKSECIIINVLHITYWRHIRLCFHVFNRGGRKA